MVEKLTVIFFIILFLLLGVYLILLPWNIFYGVGNWEQNYLLVYIAQKTDLPLLQKAVASNWARGAVTGLGVLNLIIAFWEIAHFDQSVQMLRGNEIKNKSNIGQRNDQPEEYQID
ncbi:MAG: hypothetical protein ACR2F2_03310 [Pyrinomonadaceae bacterium]